MSTHGGWLHGQPLRFKLVLVAFASVPVALLPWSMAAAGVAALLFGALLWALWWLLEGHAGRPTEGEAHSFLSLDPGDE